MNVSKRRGFISYIARKYIRVKFKIVCLYNVRRIGILIPKRQVHSHMLITGKTGSGKSTLTQQRIYDLRWRGKSSDSIIVLDPHGEMVETLRKVDLVNKNRNRLVYVDPLLMKGYTPCLNFMECRIQDPYLRELYANQLVRAFQEIIPDAKLSNQMKALLKPCIYVLLSQNTCSLIDLQELLIGKRPDLELLGKNSHVKAYRDFFASEFHHYAYERTKQSLFTKLQSLLNSQVFVQFTYGVSTLNLSQLISGSKVVLFNLSKGKLSEEVSEVLGRFIIAQVKSIALSRANLPDAHRNRIFLIIDEGDSFVNGGGSLETILKESRKYGLSLVFVNQAIVSGVKTNNLKLNLLSNTNVKVIGANGYVTLKNLHQETGIPMSDLKGLVFYEFWVSFGSYIKRKIRLRNVFLKGSPLLISKGKVLSLTHWMVKQSGYYKLIPKFNSPLEEEWMNELPSDLQENLKNKHYPKPKFTD